MKTIQRSNISQWKIGIVYTRFNSYVTDSLLKGALDALRVAGIDEGSIELFAVPGAFEIPLTCQRIFNSRPIDGIITLGAVIRGETPHFDFVAGECAKGIMNVSLTSCKPISFGVLTTDTVEQALNRAGLKHGNKGIDCANALIDQLKLFYDTSI